METRYHSAISKLNWGKQHINNLNRLMHRSLEGNSLAVQPNDDGTQHTVQFVSQPLTPEFNLTFGDAVVNMRSALDHCYAAAIGSENERTGQNYFPVRDDRKSLENWLKDPSKKRPAVPKVLQDFILDEIQPYEAGNKLIWGLNKICNIDKHRLLLTVIGESSVVVSYQHGGQYFESCTFMTDTGRKCELSTAPGPPEFNSKTQASLTILIGEREPVIFYRKPLIPTLVEIVNEVERTVGAIANLLPRGSSHGNPL